jgi:hypothetical protein
MHKRTCTRAAGVSPPWVADAGAIANVCHGWLTPAAPGAQRRSAKNDDSRGAKTHMHKSGGRQPAVVGDTMTLCRENRVMFGGHERTTKSGGRQPAVVTVTRLQRGTVSLGAMMVVIKSGGRQPAVGVGNTIAQTQARLFCRPPTVYVRIAVAFTVIVTTGGLRPPLLYCDADVRRHKKRFLRCTNARLTRAAGVSPPWFYRNSRCNGTTRIAGTRLLVASRAAGVSPPWFEFAPATASVFGHERDAHLRTQTHSHKSWRAPAAPGQSV